MVTIAAKPKTEARTVTINEICKNLIEFDEERVGIKRVRVSSVNNSMFSNGGGLLLTIIDDKNPSKSYPPINMHLSNELINNCPNKEKLYLHYGTWEVEGKFVAYPEGKHPGPTLECASLRFIHQ